MKILCLLITVLVCPAQAMSIIQPRMIIAERSNVTLKCMYNITGDGEAQTLRVSVYRRKVEKSNEVCSASFNYSMEFFERSDLLPCKGYLGKDSISIRFTSMNLSHIDQYFCKVEKMSPLPYTEGIGIGTWIFIKPDVIKEKQCPRVTLATFIILALTGVFLIYSVIITYLHWVLKKNQEEQNNEYVNMDPGRR
ncbi:T-cell-specific surface glycoprotein CD28 homolog [Narcine bancroftii]|uniref:T-cell-specific surface glycoprotein CD28 homolog n=1 Tax=Narcine bancroftii TaxID=1343680 RepID=UPI0038316DDC